MDVINLSSRKFKSLRKLELPNSVYNTEGEILVYDDKDKWNKRTHIIKRLYVNFGPVFSNKLATVNSVADLKDKIGIEEIVYPEKLLTVGGELKGFTMPFCSKYLFRLNPVLTSLSGKYHLSDMPCNGDFIPNADSDIYCYIMTILNTIFGRELQRLPIEVFYDYLEYLRKIGVSSELVEVITDIYSNKPNTNPKDLLDSLEPVFYRCNSVVFEKTYKKI